MFETFLQDVKLHMCRTSNILAASEAVWLAEATKPITVMHTLAFRLFIMYLLVQNVFLIIILFVGSCNALIISKGTTWPKEHLIIVGNLMSLYLKKCKFIFRCRSQWQRGLSRRSATARLLRLCVRIPPGARMSVCCVVCCQVEVSASGWSPVQKSPIYCGASLFVI
jgi:uncharacterized membrane protein YjdF